MARTKRKQLQRKKTTRARPRKAVKGGQQDAIALLKADHRQVEEWFEQFAAARSEERKLRLAGQICDALKVHTQIEEELFYPAFLQATGDTDTHHEAAVEHGAARKLIAEIDAGEAKDDYLDARVTVLSEMIKHHVNEEEQRDGMFAKARRSEMDLSALGKRLAARKAELLGEAE